MRFSISHFDYFISFLQQPTAAVLIFPAGSNSTYIAIFGPKGGY